MPTLVELLVDDLDGDLARRRREILDLRLMVSSSNGMRLEMLARMCHLLAYAHWEGFVKRSLKAYLSHLMKKQLKLGALKYGLQALTVREDMRRVAEPDRRVDPIAGLLKALDSRGNIPFAVSANDVVKTGNLTSETLGALLECAGLDFLDAYQLRSNFIDEVVCGRRHRIAHGEWQPVTASEARSVAEDVLDLCTELNLQIQAAALYESYRI